MTANNGVCLDLWIPRKTRHDVTQRKGRLARTASLKGASVMRSEEAQGRRYGVAMPDTI
jgi:hypothetical protein